METRSRTRVAQYQGPPDGVLEGPESRSPTGADEDLGIALMMGDGEAPIVGGGQPEMRVTTSTSGKFQWRWNGPPPRNQLWNHLGLSSLY